MNMICVVGGKKLEGSIYLQGSKNAVLPIMAATLLTEGITILENCPRIADVFQMQEILLGMGCKVWWEEKDLYILPPGRITPCVDRKHIVSMRSSVVLLGILLSETGSVTMDYPGGCVIGERPIDMHIFGLSKMGCVFENDDTKLRAKSEKMHGEDIVLKFPSVGATENLILAAVKTRGITKIRGGAREPEIIYLCQYLRKCGALIKGEGTDCISIEGVLKLHGCRYRIPADRIVAGTYLMSALITGGYISLKNAPVWELKTVTESLKKMGANIQSDGGEVTLFCKKPFESIHVTTDVYPGFPTDLQSGMLVLLTVAKGTGSVTETIYENRFRIVDELKKMGADITLKGGSAIVKGRKRLQGAVVEAKELRGNAALIMAGLAAEGKTEVLGSSFVKRGYEDICRDLKSLGAVIYEK